MYYERHRQGRGYRRMTRYWAIALLCVAAAVLLGVNTQFRRVMSDAARVQAENLFSASVSRAVLGVSADSSFDVVTVTTGGDGSIVSVQSDTGKANRLKAEITESLLSELTVTEKQPVEISLGTLSGIELLAGRGPSVSVGLELRGGVSADIVSEFCEAGINQTLHRIICNVSADYYIIMPGYRFGTTLTSSVPLAESLIVGEVPDNYTYVVGDQSDTIGRIFDYGTGQYN